MCTQDCSATACGGGFTCVDFGGTTGQLCLETCNSSTFCNSGSSCLDGVVSTGSVCWPNCHFNSECPSIGTCNEYIGFCDPNPITGADNGAACTADADCRSGVCNAADSPGVGNYPGGYCVSYCAKDDGLCPGDGACLDVGYAYIGVCFDGCGTNADCRQSDGYSCQNFGANICYF